MKTFPAPWVLFTFTGLRSVSDCVGNTQLAQPKRLDKESGKLPSPRRLSGC